MQGSMQFQFQKRETEKCQTEVTVLRGAQGTEGCGVGLYILPVQHREHSFDSYKNNFRQGYIWFYIHQAIAAAGLVSYTV